MICGSNKLFRNTCIGKAHRLLTIQIPARVKKSLKNLCPHCCCNDKSQEECVGSNGPCRFGIAIFFFIIYFFFASIYLAYVYPNLSYMYKNLNFHKNLSLFLLPIPWFVFLYFQIADPGYITADNVDQYLELFPYDNQLYTPHECRALHIPVVPRSRFCKYTFKRIAKYDHYCPWVLASVGMRTHRFFLLFLLSIVNVSSYYAYGSIKWLYIVFQQFMKKFEGQPPSEIVMNSIFGTLVNEPFVLVDAIVLGAISFVVFIFLLQHVIHVSKNETTIENEKYSDLKKQNGKKPINFYSKGFWQNWKEELFPPSLPPHKNINKKIK